MNSKAKAKKGQSAIIGTLILLLIMAGVLSMMIYFINNYSNSTQKAISVLQQNAEAPEVYYAWYKGSTLLKTTHPFSVTHIILSNGSIENVNILVNYELNITKILNGSSWAIITTNYGTYYNVSNLNVPAITIDHPDPSFVAGLPWNSSVLQKVNVTPSWTALEGVKKLIYYQQPVRAQSEYILFNGSLSDVEAVAYLDNSSNQFLNIVYYAPPEYLSNVSNPYWDYYLNPGGAIPVGEGGSGYYSTKNYYSDPWDSLSFFTLISSNPYVGLWSPLEQSAVYYQCVHSTLLGASYSVPIDNPQGGIEFNYTVINATIGVYIPTFINSSSSDVVDSYIFFRDFEITNLSAFVPYNVSPGIYNPNGTWVYSPYSWIDAPLLPSPYVPASSKAYSPSPDKTFQIIGVNPSGFYDYAPLYEQFPTSTSWSGFPAYFGSYYIPTYQYLLNDSANWKLDIISQFYPENTYASYFNLPSPLYSLSNQYTSNSHLINSHENIIDLYQLSINLETGQLLNYGYSETYHTWILLYNGTINRAINTIDFQYMPVYIIIPQGTFLLTFYLSNQPEFF